MVTPDHGIVTETVQVSITFSIPLDTVLDSGPVNYSLENQHQPEVQAMFGRRRLSLPESDHDLLHASKNCWS